MAFIAEQRTINELLSNAIYTIPRNQRRYVWGKENWKDLFNDVVFASENNEQNKSHFLGSIVLQEETKRNALGCYTIIDGQQRIMTIILFLAAIMLHFRKHNYEADFNGTVKYLQSVDTKNNKVLVFETDYHKSLEKIVKHVIEITYDDSKNKSLTAFVNTAVINKIRDKKISECFKYFFSEIEILINKNVDSDKSIQAVLSELRDEIINMTYVSIVATTEEDSYTIFEILNARGQTLDSHELLKNYIMRYYEPVESRDSAKTIWEEMETKLGKDLSAFIMHYASHKYNASKEDRKDPYMVVRKAKPNVKELIEDIQKKSDYYGLFINPEKTDDDDKPLCNQIEKKTFDFFKKRKITQFRPILLSLMHQKDIEGISAEDYDKTITFLFKFLTCYIFIGSERTNRFSDTIYKYAPIIENNFTMDYLNEFINNLKEKIPSEGWFEAIFQNIGYSKKGALNEERAKEIVQTILLMQEQHLRKSELPIDFTIEHIMPDSASENNAHIGNLLPLEEHFNQECGSRPLEEKIEIYKKSSFVAARKFIERYGNSPETFKIDVRTKYMSQMFYNDILKLGELTTDIKE